ANKLYAEYQKVQQAAQAKAVKIFQADPKSETGLDAAIWALPGLRAKSAEQRELVESVLEHHVANKKIAGLIGTLSFQASTDPKPLDASETIARKNPNKPVQAQALFAIAELYKNKAEPYGKKAPADADELAEKAEAGFERVEKDYAAEVQYGKRTYGDA